MARSAVLDVKVLVDAAQAATGLNQTAAKFESFGKKLAGAVVAAVAIKGVGELAKTVVTAASTMEQAVGGTDKVFGSSAAEIHKWAADSSDAIRLPAVAVEQYATLIKTQLAATGQPMAQLVQSTKALITVGADLSAVTGRDLADSISAVKSALAGEYDPIQNLGVAISGASVQARAFAIANGDATLAASDAVIMQARYAEIMDKSAFATGAAAEEADSFQGRMDSLNEKVQNLAAAVGGPLLDSLGNIVSGVTDAAAGAETLGVGLGTMLGTVLSLPGPIQAVVAGLAAFGIVSAVWGAKAFGAFTTFVGHVKSATGSVSGLKSALSSLGPALAGGALLVGAAVLIGLFAQAIGRVTEGAKKGEDALGGYRDAIVAAGGASNDATAKAFEQAVVTSEAFDALVQGGFSGAEATRILTGTQEEWIAVQGSGSAAARDLTKDTLALTDGFIDANGHAKDLATAQLEGVDAMNQAGQAAKQLGPTIAESEKAAADAADKAAEKQKELAEAIKKAQEAASRTVVSRALEGLKVDAESATRAIEFLGAAIDTATGGTRAYEDTLVGFNSSLTGVADAFATAKEAGDLNTDALVAWNVNALTQTKTGQDVYASLRQVQSGYETLVGTAYASAAANKDNAGALQEAQNNAGYAYDSFISMAGAMGLSDEQARTLAQNLGILDATQLDPKIFQLIADDTAARATVTALQAQGFDPIHFTLEAGADGAIGTVDDTISYINGAGERAEILVNADPTPAEGTVDKFTGEKRETNEVAILANSAPARNAMIAFLSDYSKMTLTATVNANTASARSAVEAFRSDYSGVQVTATILGNSAPARSAIAAVENGSYSATVRIIADTSGFFATFNSLPGSKPVAAVQRVAVPVPTFAAPSLSSTSDAPVAARNVGTGNVTINVSGAIDPDSTARQIRQLLDRRDRRAGGIRI